MNLYDVNQVDLTDLVAVQEVLVEVFASTLDAVVGPPSIQPSKVAENLDTLCWEVVESRKSRGRVLSDRQAQMLKVFVRDVCLNFETRQSARYGVQQLLASETTQNDSN